MKFNVVVLLCAFASISISSINGYNVETKHYTIYQEEQRSMFGFSVAEHLDRNRHGWVIVGAPEAQTAQPGVFRGGSVYRCDILQDNSCAPIYFDTEGNKVNANPAAPYQVDNKTMQWFGATVSTSQTVDGPILACAPRYIWFSANLMRREPIGTCYLTQHSFSEPKEFSPCRTRHWGYHRQGSCQAGLGAALSKDGERVMIGAPGSYYWQGQVYSIDSNAEFPYMPPRYSFFGGATGQTFSASTDRPASVFFTKEGRALDDDSYLGYSVATGDFEGNGQTGAAVGMPRGENLHGKVVLLRSNMSHQRNLTGDQMGAYFGYAVVACDVDGDGLDDLVIGAPMYTVEDNPEMTFETGRVHIFYQGSGPEKFSRSETRDGVENRGRFGLSLASLNDINRDGFQDFAVGAPYGGPDGRGAVYVYHGSKTGVLEKHSQAIYARDMESPISTFGFSVSGGLDLDGNMYPDIVVGAYDSSTVAFFRSRPVVNMEAYVAFDSNTKSISLDDKNCTLNDGTTVPCLELDSCLNYTGLGVGRSYQFNVQYVLDVKKPKNPRLFFVEYETRNSINQTIRLARDERLCKTFKVFVSPNIKDKLTSIDVEMRMSLIEDRPTITELRNPTSQLTPVLGATTSKPDSLSIFKSCGQDNVCVPNLQLQINPTVKKYLLGSGDKLDFNVLVQNEGEDAFEAMYYLKLPDGIKYINIDRIDKTEVPVQCSAPSLSNNNTLRCEIGNPLPSKNFVHFKVILQPITSQDMEPSFELEMLVNTTNPEMGDTQDDNRFHLSIPIWIQTELFIEGKSKPKDVYYNFENYTSENITNEWDFGPLLIHNYTIRNDGPSRIVEAEASLIWPAQTLAGEELVYLLEQPETSGPIQCETANANYLSLALDQRRRVQMHYSGLAEGFSGGENVDKANQFAEAERRKQLKEGHGENGTREQMKEKDYDYGTEILVTPNGSKKLSAGYSKNFTKYESGKVSSGQNKQFSFQQGGSGSAEQGADIITGSEVVTEIYGSRFQAPIQTAIPLPRENYNVGGSSTFEETHYDKKYNKTGVFQHGWDDVDVDKIQKQYYLDNQRLELERRQEQERRLQAERRQEEERLQAERRQEEEIRLQAERRQEEERRLLIERRQEEERRLEAERRQEEERRLQAQRQRLNERPDVPSIYGVQKHYITDAENSRRQQSGFGITSGGVATGDQERRIGNSGFNLQLSNIGSSKDLEQFFSTLNHEAGAFTTHSRDGKEYVLFDGRFRVSNGREFVQFRNGEAYDLLDSRGEPSYTTDRSQSERYASLEGELVGEDGKIYIKLNDGRRFRIPGTYTYEKKETYTVSGGPRETVGERKYVYGKQITQEGSSGDERILEPYGNNYREESYEENYKSGRKIISGRGGTTYESRETFHGDNVPTNRPDERHSRYPRESDMMEVEEFKKWEKRQRHQRDLDDGDFEENQFAEALSMTHRDRRAESVASSTEVGGDDVPSCKSARCVKLQCTIGSLAKGQEVWIAMRARVKAKTLNQMAFNEKVKVSTQLVARVTRQPFIGAPSEQVIKSHEIFTTINPSAAPTAPDVVPLWVVVLSACAGAIILLLLIFLLYKCGFFKRNRPTDAPERQPLNTNGHFSSHD